jgi:hypothetical protein
VDISTIPSTGSSTQLVLVANSIENLFSINLYSKLARPTSFLVTGLSNNTRCVRLRKFPNASRSANSAKLFSVSTSVVRFGIELATEGWMPAILLRARRSVRNRGDSGKFPKVCISLSVKSIASCGYTHRHKLATIPKYRKT